MTKEPRSRPHFVLTHNGELIRYPTLAIARAMWLDQSVVYTSVEQMVERLSLDEMDYLYRRVMHTDSCPYQSKQVAAEKLFPLLCIKSSPHNPFSKGKGRKKLGRLLPSEEHDIDPRDRLQTVSLADMRLHFAGPHVFDALSQKLATQAYVLGRYLSQHCPDEGYTWDGVQMDIMRAHDENVLRTRQAPDRIFRYYIDPLINNGLLSFTDKDGRPCDRPRNKKKDDSLVVRHPLKKNPGFLV